MTETDKTDKTDETDEMDEADEADERSSRTAGSDTHEAVFGMHRRRLLGVSYRVLGSVVDAEDVLQEAWFRWAGTDPAVIENPEAFLTTVVTRLSLDRLRRVKARREVYAGPWLPEPVTADLDPRNGDPEAAVELADSLSLALLVVLETLSPLERAAFVLREVFGESYPAVAAMLDREEPTVRQLVHRARQRVEAGRTRYRADRATHAAVVRRFMAACQSADLDGLLAVLAPDVVIISDGGGMARAPKRPVHGRDKVARLMLGILPRALPGTTMSFEIFNGQLGIVARLDGRATGALAVSVSDGTVQSLYLIANPTKLTALDQPS